MSRNRAIALAYGVSCHTFFLAAIVAAMASMYQGMQLGLVRLPPRESLAWDALLLVQFPLGHSLLLSAKGRHWMLRLAPTPHRLRVLGPLLKERRYRRFYGEVFADYSKRVPYFKLGGFVFGLG